MEIKLFDSELKIMDILWKEGDIPAKRIAEITNKQVGWRKPTTYTVIKKCLEKGAIRRTEPNFVCHALITKEQAQQFETAELINKMYDGATDRLVASIISSKKLTSQDIKDLKLLVSSLE